MKMDENTNRMFNVKKVLKCNCCGANRITMVQDEKIGTFIMFCQICDLADVSPVMPDGLA